MKLQILLWLAGLLLLSGCNMMGGGVRVEPVATSAQRPSNVAVYMSVSDGDRPITGLDEKDFAIYEDGQKLDAAQTQQTLLPRDTAAVHRTLLLVDMSGPITEGQTRQQIADAAARFATRAHKTQPVSVYAFDGGPRIRQVGDYPKGDEEVSSIPGLESYTSTDVSSNLNSAVVEAIKELDTKLMATAKPIRIGTLVIFARGPDLARRTTEDEAQNAIDETDHHVFAIGLETDQDNVAGSLEKDGLYMASSMSSLRSAFDEAGERAARIVDQYYLLSYCSPARAGERTLRIEVTATDEEGSEIGGSLHSEFNADGFSSGCNPKAAPRFVIPPSAKEEDDDEGSEPASGGSPAPAPQPAEPRPDDDVVPPPDKPGYAK